MREAAGEGWGTRLAPLVQRRKEIRKTLVSFRTNLEAAREKWVSNSREANAKRQSLRAKLERKGRERKEKARGSAPR